MLRGVVKQVRNLQVFRGVVVMEFSSVKGRG